MRIACFWTDLHPAAQRALPVDAELVWVGDSDTAYWRELSKRWDGSDDLMVIEHDIEIHADVVPQFTRCPSDWCCFPYQYGPRWPGDHEINAWPGDQIIIGALGCTRFSAELQRFMPIDTIAASVSATDGMPPSPLWHYCDLYIRRALTRADIKVCQHTPLVTHHRGGTRLVKEPE